MIGTIIKPSIGLSPEELAEVVGELAAAGHRLHQGRRAAGQRAVGAARRARARGDAGARAARRPHGREAHVRLQHHRRHRSARGATTTSSWRPAARASWRASTSSGSPGSSSCGGTATVPIHGHRAMFGAIAARSRSGSRSARGRSSRGSPAPTTCTPTASATSSTRTTPRCSTRSPAVREPLLGLTPTRAGALVGAVGRARARDLRGGRHDRPARPRRRRHPRPPRRRAAGVASMRDAWASAERGESRRRGARSVAGASARGRGDVRAAACADLAGRLLRRRLHGQRRRAAAVRAARLDAGDCSLGLPDGRGPGDAPPTGVDVVGIAGIAAVAADRTSSTPSCARCSRRSPRSSRGSCSTRRARRRTRRRPSAASAG